MMAQKMSKALHELDDLLASVEEWVRSKLREAQIMTGIKQAEYTLHWYGGMGSFNDLILSNTNRHSLADSEFKTKNDKLDRLRGVIWELANESLRK